MRDIRDDIQIVSGGAKGADILGEQYAKERNYSIKRFVPNWKDLDVPGAVVKSNAYGEYNSRAGMDRNKNMADYADSAVVFLQPGLPNKGSRNIHSTMQKLGKPSMLANNNKGL